MREEIEQWLKNKYINELCPKADIAVELGCSIHNVNRLLSKYSIKRGKAYQLKTGVWNKGLTKHDHPSIMAISEGRIGEGNPMWGVSAWNKGIKPEENETVALMTSKMREGYNRGLESGETRKKMSAAKMGKSGKNANNYIRGYSDMVNGYRSVSGGGKAEYEHRLIASKMLGRKLESHETVHHFDGNKINNEPENLVVIFRGVHTKLHRYCFPATRAEQIRWLTSNKYNYGLLG